MKRTQNLCLLSKSVSETFFMEMLLHDLKLIAQSLSEAKYIAAIAMYQWNSNFKKWKENAKYFICELSNYYSYDFQLLNWQKDETY